MASKLNTHSKNIYILKPLASSHLYSWLERDTVRLKLQNDPVTPRTQTNQSIVQYSKRPQVLLKYLYSNSPQTKSHYEDDQPKHCLLCSLEQKKIHVRILCHMNFRKSTTITKVLKNKNNQHNSMLNNLKFDNIFYYTSKQWTVLKACSDWLL